MIKELAKITKAEFGQYPDKPFLFGLQLSFEGKGWGVADVANHTFNLGDEVWKNSGEDKAEYIEKQLQFLNKILLDAKVHHVSQLKGKPVEVTMENGMFKGFRILTEVI